jgi:RNA polymerase sigma-70 factor (ECF subfamily)
MHDPDMAAVYEEFAPVVYKYLFCLTRDRALSEELTQETFFQAVRSIHRFDGSCLVSTWLCGIAKNVLHAHWRSREGRTLPMDDIPEPSVASAEETVLKEMELETILAAIHRIPEPGKEILHLRLLGGLSFKQIGAVLNHTENWARVSYYRARQLLIKELENDES